LRDAHVDAWRPLFEYTKSWILHRDINHVMLATSLVPEGYLVLG
jgi:hypothetical protein